MQAVAADITTPEGQDEVIATAGEVVIVVTNAGGPPVGDWRDWDRTAILAALDASLLAPIALMRALVPGMCDRRWGRVFNITSVSVRAPIPGLGLSSTARAGLTGYVADMARAVAPFGDCINNLLPGSHDTARTAALVAAETAARGLVPEEVRAEEIGAIPTGRFGTEDEFGAACAFLWSAQAGFIVGQNLLIDGGATRLVI